jgi:hypothetical protein|tara:strand:+ start:658 stop:1698 length:1041 start_codon:yes stop_codon:yes gene_type:complete
MSDKSLEEEIKLELEEGKKMKQEDEVKDVEEDVKDMKSEGGLPPGLKKAIDKKKGKADDEDEDDEDDEEMEEVKSDDGYSEVEDPKDIKGKKRSGDNTKKESKEIEIDVSEHVEALIAGEEMSEEFKVKATTIFETAVKSKVKDIVESLETEIEARHAENFKVEKEEIVENVDKYLEYVSSQWMKDNELAVETGLKEEISSEFITGLKNLFEEHYIDIPDEKIDLVGELQVTVNEQEEKINKEINDSIELKKELVEYKKKDIFTQVTTNLVDTEVEKMKKLSENVEFEDAEDYAEKLNTLKENYFNSPKSEKLDVEKSTAGTNKEISEDGSPVDAYVQAISRSVKK